MARILDVFAYDENSKQQSLGSITLNDDGTCVAEGQAATMVEVIPCRDADGNDHTIDEGEAFFEAALEAREFNKPPYLWVQERTNAAPPALKQEPAPMPPEAATPEAAPALPVTKKKVGGV